jgi:L-amino acid N-acyltransferase YncA
MEEINSFRSENKPIYIAEEDKIVGFASFGPERKQSHSIDSELYAIYLLKEAKGKRVGTSLLYEGVTQLRKCGSHSLLVWVLESNSSKAFYENYGGEVYLQEEITIGNQKLVEVAYVWKNLSVLQDKLALALSFKGDS